MRDENYGSETVQWEGRWGENPEKDGDRQIKRWERHGEGLRDVTSLESGLVQRPTARDINPGQREMERQRDKTEAGFRERRPQACWGTAGQDSLWAPGLEGWRD